MGTRKYAPYYNSKNGKTIIIAKDDDGYWFNAGIKVQDVEDGKRVAGAMEASER